MYTEALSFGKLETKVDLSSKNLFLGNTAHNLRFTKTQILSIDNCGIYFLYSHIVTLLAIFESLLGQ